MIELGNSFENDLIGEAVVIDFLEKYFYSHIDFKSYERINNLDKQHQGIDLVFSTETREYIVDEKSAMHYPRGLPTFAFELTYLKNGSIREGWFYDDKKLTEYYLLIWPIREDVPPKEMKVEHIHSAEIMLIHRKEFQEYIYKKYKLNREEFLDKAKDIRERGTVGDRPFIAKESSAKYYLSNNYQEQPINVVFRKEEILKSGSVKSYYEITRERYVSLLR